jgi:hypothetical protein
LEEARELHARQIAELAATQADEAARLSAGRWTECRRNSGRGSIAPVERPQPPTDAAVAFAHFVAPPIVVQAVARPEPAPVQVVHQVVTAPLDAGDVEARVARQIWAAVAPELERMNGDRNELRRIVMEQQRLLDLFKEKERRDRRQPDEETRRCAAVSEAGGMDQITREAPPARGRIQKQVVSAPKAFEVSEAPEEVGEVRAEMETKHPDQNGMLELAERADHTEQRVAELESRFAALDGRITGLVRSVDELGAICSSDNSKVPEREAAFLPDRVLPTPEEDDSLPQSRKMPQPTPEPAQLEKESAATVNEPMHPAKAPERPAKASGKPPKGRAQPAKGPGRRAKGGTVQPIRETFHLTDEPVPAIEEPAQPTEEPVQPAEEAVQPAEEAVQPMEEQTKPIEEAAELTENETEVTESLPLTEVPIQSAPGAIKGRRLTLVNHFVRRDIFDRPPPEHPRDPRTDFALEEIARLVNDVADLHVRFDSVDRTTSDLRLERVDDREKDETISQKRK